MSLLNNNNGFNMNAVYSVGIYIYTGVGDSDTSPTKQSMALILFLVSTYSPVYKYASKECVSVCFLHFHFPHIMDPFCFGIIYVYIKRGKSEGRKVLPYFFFIHRHSSAQFVRLVCILIQKNLIDVICFQLFIGFSCSLMVCDCVASEFFFY